MTESNRAQFRLTVLNPGGRDPEQHFSVGAGEIAQSHAPVNFHAYAACTRGSFHREMKSAIAEGTPVLLLLRGDFRASERALGALQNEERFVAVSLKETGLHQIAHQLRHIPGAVDVHVQQMMDLPTLHLDVDRVRAQQVGISERDVARGPNSRVSVPGPADCCARAVAAGAGR